MAKKKPKKLVIVESPAKARTINKYLGPDYEVSASLGHVRDLPKQEFGIDIEAGFVPKYVVIQGKGTPKLREAAKRAEAVYLAPDPDREGEAIAWHLVEALRIPAEKVFRVTFNEITERAVKKAFENPQPINLNKVYAQQARRILDRIIGYRVSPLLRRKISRGLSAGRVQSVAVRLIVEREREIEAFHAEEYWSIAAWFPARASGQEEGAGAFCAEIRARDGKKFVPGNEAEATAVVETVERAGRVFRVSTVEQKEVRNRPVPPFATSQLQQAASTRLGFTTSRTMRTAQALYQGEVEIGGEGVGLITYMRTDSFRVASEALETVRAMIHDRFGEAYLPEKPNFYKTRAGAQDAHECIRPTDVRRDPESLRPYLTKEQYRLYELIWKRFVASQMTPARFLATSVDLVCEPYTFRATGRVSLFDGHLKVSGRTARELDRLSEKDTEKGDEPDETAEENGDTNAETKEARKRKKDPDQSLPEIKEGEERTAEEIIPDQHFTKPPARYSEASLVKTLERKGIGRPSTYTQIVQTVQDRGYVIKERRQLVPTELGSLVTDKLVNHFPTFMDYKFTSQIESQLDQIEEAKQDWVQVLENFYRPFMDVLEKANEEMESIKGEAAMTEYKCEKCDKPMLKRMSRYGSFLGCSGYPECKHTVPLGPDGKPQDPEDTTVDVKCDECGGQMAVKRSRFGQFLGCENYPECRNTMRIAADGSFIKRPKQPPADPICKCAKCGKDMIVRAARRGGRLFVGCTGYPRCRNIVPLPAPDEVQLLREYSQQEKDFIAEMEKAGAEKQARQAERQAKKKAVKKAAKKTAKKAKKKKTARKKSAGKSRAKDSAPVESAAPPGTSDADPAAD